MLIFFLSDENQEGIFFVKSKKLFGFLEKMS